MSRGPVVATETMVVPVSSTTKEDAATPPITGITVVIPVVGGVVIAPVVGTTIVTGIGVGIPTAVTVIGVRAALHPKGGPGKKG